MARIETWLKCNLQSMVRVQELSGDLFTADNQANRIGVIVTDNNGQPVQLTGGVIGYIIRPDEATVVVNGSISSNRGWIDLPASAYAVKGPISIVIKNGNTTIGACHGYIKRSTTDHIIDPGHEVPSLSELLAEIANMRTATSAANTAASSANNAAGAANTAATNANNKANVANTAAGAANEAATNANGAAGKINNMTVAASGLTAGSAPTVTVSDVSGHKHILFGIPKGDKGDRGKDFRIKRTFASIAQMEAYDPSQDQSSYKVLEFDYVMIDTGSVSDVDTGKLYCYEPHEQTVWHYIGDLSGAQGIKGETGNGISSVQLNQDYTLTIMFTDGSSVTTTSIRGASGNETIDDTAGIGDTDLVYSADKVRKELDTKAPVVDVPLTTPASVQSFPDGADELPMALTVGIEPVQDLHGYDNPWPAGGGKNLLDTSVLHSGMSFPYTMSGVTFTRRADGAIVANGTATADIPLAIVIGVTDGNYYFNGAYDGSGDTYNTYIWDTTVNARAKQWDGATPSINGYLGLTQVKIEEGHTYYFNIRVMRGFTANNVIFYPMLCRSTETDPTFAPYSNICPISGWNGVKIERTGKNILPTPSTLRNVGSSYTSNGITETRNADNSLSHSGTANADTWFYFNRYSATGEYNFRFKPGNYKLTCDGLTGGLSNLYRFHLSVYDIGSTAVKRIYTITNEEEIDVTINEDEWEAAYIFVPSGKDMTGITLYPMLQRDGYGDSEYVPYNSEAYNITFPSQAGTVYGGTLTVNKDGTGELIVDRFAFKTTSDIINTDSSITSISQRTNTLRFWIYGAGLPENTKNTRNARYDPLICDRLPTNVGDVNAYDLVGAQSSPSYPRSYCLSIPTGFCGATASEIRTYINANPYQFCMKLKSTASYELTTDQVKTLLGVNNLFADCGSITEVRYPADTKLYIDKKFAELQALILENISNT